MSNQWIDWNKGKEEEIEEFRKAFDEAVKRRIREELLWLLKVLIGLTLPWILLSLLLIADELKWFWG